MNYAALYTEINIIAVLLTAMVLFKTTGVSRISAQREFSIAVYSEMAFCVSDTLFTMLLRENLPWNPEWLRLFKGIYFVSTCTMCYFWFMYFERVAEGSIYRNKRKRWASSILVGIMLVLCLLNPLTNLLFYVDETNGWTRGPLFLSQYVLSYTYVIWAVVRLFKAARRQNNYLERRKLLHLALLPMIPMVAGMIQLIFRDIPVSGIAMAFVTLIVYMNAAEEMISVDPLTKLNNRKQFTTVFYHKYQHWEGGKAYLLVMDINRFKYINDHFGHNEGDDALRIAADGLRKAVSEAVHRPQLARYGGDEFVILMEADSPDEIEQMKRRINEILHDLRVSEDKPYFLSMSVGYAERSEVETLKEWFGLADKRLYQEKDVFKRRFEKKQRESA